jgi:hypothetical protein
MGSLISRNPTVKTVMMVMYRESRGERASMRWKPRVPINNRDKNKIIGLRMLKSILQYASLPSKQTHGDVPLGTTL